VAQAKVRCLGRKDGKRCPGLHGGAENHTPLKVPRVEEREVGKTERASNPLSAA